MKPRNSLCGKTVTRGLLGVLAGSLAPVGAGAVVGTPAWAGPLPATGYVATWYFNANDSTPTVKVAVSRHGTFAFQYRPAECSSGSFHIAGAFRSGSTTVDGTPGQLVTFSATGSCSGEGGHFTWKNATGAAVGNVAGKRWPDSRYVYGQLTQVVTAAGGAHGSLQIDWGLSAISPV